MRIEAIVVNPLNARRAIATLLLGVLSFGCGARSELTVTDRSCALPRLIAPLSTSIVLSDHPRLSWTAAPGSVVQHLVVCADLACSAVEFETEVRGAATAQVSAALRRGPHFWQVRSQCGSSVTWEFNVRGSGGATSAFGASTDLDLDGHRDLIVAAPNTADAALFVFDLSRGTTARRYFGGELQGMGSLLYDSGDHDGDGLPEVTSASYSTSARIGYASVYSAEPVVLGASPWGDVPSIFASDIDRDGYGDSLSYDDVRASLSILTGGPTARRRDVAIATSRSTIVSGADFDGDDLADIVVVDRATNQLMVLPGNAETIAGAIRPVLRFPADESIGTLLLVPDADGDGSHDLIATGIGPNDTPFLSLITHLRAPAPVVTSTHVGFASIQVGDVDGDGVDELLVLDQVSPRQAQLRAISMRDAFPAQLIPRWTRSFDIADGLLCSTALVADLTNDGFDDTVIACGTYPLHSVHAPPGAVWVVPGAPRGESPAPIRLRGPEESFDAFGQSVASGAGAGNRGGGAERFRAS